MSACASRWLTAISGLSWDQRDRLGRGQPDDHAADQTRAGGGGDAVERREAEVGLAHRPGDDVVERLDMGASGDLRHHAAEGGVLADLREHDIGEDPALGLIGRSTTAAAVSSQVVSMPRTTMGVL